MAVLANEQESIVDSRNSRFVMKINTSPAMEAVNFIDSRWS